MPRFIANPGEFRHSEAYFRMLVLVTVLQRDIGLRYDPSKIALDSKLEPSDTFLVGVMRRKLGTCASLPVAYAAVARQLDYPVCLVRAKAGSAGHLFCRWEGNGERRNMEVTNLGLSCHPDAYYRAGIYGIAAEIEEKCCLLKSMTPRQELSSFLMERGMCWKECGRWQAAAEAIGWACGLHPENQGYIVELGRTLDAWHNVLETWKPPSFPGLVMNWRSEFPPALPADMARNYYGLLATEHLLNHRTFESDWWAPLRRGERPVRPVPREVTCMIGVNHESNGDAIDFSF
jgi:hypothetical protein